MTDPDEHMNALIRGKRTPAPTVDPTVTQAINEAAVVEAINGMGARDPHQVWRYARHHLQFDSVGHATNLVQVVGELQRDRPELFGFAGNGSADGGAGGRRPSPPDMNDAIRTAAGR
jgi:hypothetical protein